VKEDMKLKNQSGEARGRERNGLQSTGVPKKKKKIVDPEKSSFRKRELRKGGWNTKGRVGNKTWGRYKG